MDSPGKIMLCGCRNSADYTNFWPIEDWRILCLSCSNSLSYAFGREEEGTVLGDIEVCLTRNLCECISTCGIPENVP